MPYVLNSQKSGETNIKNLGTFQTLVGAANATGLGPWSDTESVNEKWDLDVDDGWIIRHRDDTFRIAKLIEKVTIYDAYLRYFAHLKLDEKFISMFKAAANEDAEMKTMVEVDPDLYDEEDYYMISEYYPKVESVKAEWEARSTHRRNALDRADLASFEAYAKTTAVDFIECYVKEQAELRGV